MSKDIKNLKIEALQTELTVSSAPNQMRATLRKSVTLKIMYTILLKKSTIICHSERKRRILKDLSLCSG